MTAYTPEEQQKIGAAQQASLELRQTEEAFATIRRDMLEAIAKSNLGETVLREKLYMGVNVLDQIKSMLEVLASSGATVEYDALMRELAGEGQA